MKDHTMSLSLHKVGLVVDRTFGDRIPSLARSFHVWVVESPNNTQAIQQVWKSERPEPASDPLGSGVTSFKASAQESPEEICIRIVGDIDEHHGEFAHDQPWSEIEVFGVKLSPRLQRVFAEFGAVSFEATPDGFICRRPPKA